MEETESNEKKIKNEETINEIINILARKEYTIYEVSAILIHTKRRIKETSKVELQL